VTGPPPNAEEWRNADEADDSDGDHGDRGLDLTCVEPDWYVAIDVTVMPVEPQVISSADDSDEGESQWVPSTFVLVPYDSQLDRRRPARALWCPGTPIAAGQYVEHLDDEGNAEWAAPIDPDDETDDDADRHSTRIIHQPTAGSITGGMKTSTASRRHQLA
jgi:hypothetical protein